MLRLDSLLLCTVCVVCVVCVQDEGSNTTDRVTLGELMSWVPSIAELLQVNVSNHGCVQQSLQLLQRAERLDSQALHILDSWAKFPSGVLRGNINQLGDFDQCVEAGGRYCLATLDIRLPTSLTHLDMQLHAHYAMRSTVDDPGHRLPKFSLVHWGLCVPEACSPTDLEEALIYVFSVKKVRARVDPDLCYCHNDPPPASSLATTLTWCFFIFIFLVCLLGTAVEVRKTTGSAVKLGRLQVILEAFSIRSNVRSLLDTTTPQSNIASLHGVRALNAMALLLSHKQMALLFLPLVNRTHLAQLIGRGWSMVGRSAILYTDSFILLSGLLSGRFLLRELSRSNKINLKDFILSRFIRFTPSLAALILFCTVVLPSLGSGPLWPLLVTKYANLCQKYWWRNLLYAHNHFPFHQMCLTHSHQVGIDMQLSLVAPLLVYPLWWRPAVGLTLLLAVALWSSMLRYTVALSEQLSTVIYFGIPISQLFRTAEKTYVLPSHRGTVYCLGVALGYYLHQNKSCSLNYVQVALGWVLGIACGLAAMFAPYHMSWSGYIYSPQEAAVYNLLAPVLWSLFVGWVVFASHYEYAGWFGRLLAWRWFAVFTRLSYAVYLTQFPIFFYNVGRARTSQQYSFFKLVDLPEFAAVLLVSVVLTLMFDLPAQNLKKAFLFSSKDVKRKLANEEHGEEKDEQGDENSETLKKSALQLQRRKRLPG